MLQVTAIVELVWQDASGTQAVTQLRAPSSWTVSDIDAFATAAASIIAPLTDCVLVGQRIKYKSALEPVTLPIGGNPIVKVAAFFFSTGSGLPDALITVPSVKDSILVADGPTAGYAVELTNSDVEAFTDAVIANGISNPFADDVTVIAAAYLQSRV